MEIKELYPAIYMLVIVGLLVGVAVLTFDKFGVAVKDETIITDELQTITGGAATLTNDDVIDITELRNQTVTMHTSEYNWTTAGVITTNHTWPELNATYTYDKDTKATTFMTAGSTAVGDIGVTWMSLIVTVLVLGVILVLTLRAFSNKGR